MADNLAINEIFGPTFQGEGPSSGRCATFMRLMGCNLKCSWCDTPYTWDSTRFNLKEETKLRGWADAGNAILRIGSPLLVITGGEPMLHQKKPDLLMLLNYLISHGMSIEVETNGTVAVSQGWCMYPRVRFNVSPKLSNSNNPEEKRLNWTALASFDKLPNTAFKFVVQTQEDLLEVAEVAEVLKLQPEQIWIMPERVDPEDQAFPRKEILDQVKAFHWNLSLRLQVLLWGNQRGV